ncbi:glycosyltransferase family A protein [Flavobacterium litorale]|uniref:Glycosyltransferase family 2 protein n=1 Tax=Flavobacterium litorale TaxID=2856519 RepID=A0ABX8V3R7_9FLAO|nr:glycosyltransferase family A protein [Flavobacterium litorale]QYJ67488.1 glycosyltransferase family 2 protein [Flavobacterium litorale]
MITADSLTIAIATMFRENLIFLDAIIPKSILKSINVLIVNQTDSKRQLQSVYNNITVINTSERGLANSRNMAIANITTTYAILTDDDVIFRDDLLNSIDNGFKLFPDAAVVKFKAAKTDDIPFNEYSNSPIKNLSIFGIMNVSSIELVVNIKKLKQSKAFFDDNFGLGAIFGNGLEQAFLDNVRKKKLQIAYYPKFIVSHPDDCSGRDSGSDRYYFINGALSKKMFGSMSLLWTIVFLFFQVKQKNIKLRSVLHYYRIFRKGAQEYKKVTE